MGNCAQRAEEMAHTRLRTHDPTSRSDTVKFPIRTAAVAFALLLAACGREEAPLDPAAQAADETPTATPAETASEAPAADPVADAVADDGGVPAAAAGPDPAAPLAVGDLDAYVRGVSREIELLKGHAEALAKARAAKDEAGEIAALAALGGAEVRDAGAEAAGLDAARYAAIKDGIDEVLSAVEMGAAMKPQLDAAEAADISGFTEEQRKQHEESIAQMRAAWAAPHERLPADVVEPFKAREAELAKLRAEALALRLGALQG